MSQPVRPSSVVEGGSGSGELGPVSREEQEAEIRRIRESVRAERQREEARVQSEDDAELDSGDVVEAEKIRGGARWRGRGWHW